MAYVRTKEVHGGTYTYYQLVEGKRVNGQVRQKVLAHLGPYPTVDRAIEGFSRRLANLEEQVNEVLAAAERHRIIAEQAWQRVVYEGEYLDDNERDELWDEHYEHFSEGTRQRIKARKLRKKLKPRMDKLRTRLERLQRLREQGKV